MYTKLFIASFLIFLAAEVIHAQVDFQTRPYTTVLSTKTMEPRLVEIIDGITTYHYALNRSKLNGSPYLSEEFVLGALTIADGTRVEGLKIRYDIYADQMQFILKSDTASINKPMALKSLELEDKTFIYEVYQVSENVVSAGYFELIIEGKLSLLLRRELELEYDVYVPNYGGGGGTKEIMLKKNNNFYTIAGKSTARKIYKKKDFLNAITEHHDLVKNYMKENRISVRKQKELEELVNYYNTL
jgi:hypothetical protein